MRQIRKINPGEFDANEHYYQKVVNAQLHPLMRFFMGLTSQQIISRYCHLNPQTDPQALADILAFKANYLRWAGADLFYVTTASGVKKIVVVEVNSCPSGQKSMPLRDDLREHGGYEIVIKDSFLPMLDGRSKKSGALAVIYDKNLMEVSGYAKTIADLADEPVYILPCFQSDWRDFVRFNDEKILEFRDKGKWRPVRAAFRYVTQKPWNRILVDSKTLIYNPVISCLAGGRNKSLAAKAYELYNAELSGIGLKINIPHTINDVAKMEIPFIIRSLGGRGVVKIPYSNAGQGVYTITNAKELKDFMEQKSTYDRYIVQSLIGNSRWSSTSPEGELYHVGTMPNKKNEIFVADLRFMVCSGPDGFLPVCLYARRTKKPLVDELTGSTDSWEILGTNLSVKKGEDDWGSETDRLLLMDTRDFNKLGLGLDQLIEGYVQTVLSVIAVDKMAGNLLNDKGVLKKKLFRSLNKDNSYLDEIYEKGVELETTEKI